jgi:hypothetical protein
MATHGLKPGDRIIFSRTPCGSWTRPGELYEVDWSGEGSVYFRNVERGSGTFDPHWAVERAEFVKMPETLTLR